MSVLWLSGILLVFAVWKHYGRDKDKNINRISLFFGCFMCIGLLIVAYVPVTENKALHYIGAGIVTIVGVLYLILTSNLCGKTSSNSKFWNTIKRIRIILSYFYCFGLCVFIASETVRYIFNKEDEEANLDIELLMKPTTNGSCHYYPNDIRNIELISAIVEWIIVFTLLAYLGLYSVEFQIK